MKGNISIAQLIGWGLAIAIPTVSASLGYTSSQIGKIQDQNTSTVQRVSVVETQSAQYQRDIEQINRKLDALTNALGVKVK